MLLRTQTTFQPPTRCNCRPHCTCCTLRALLLVYERERERVQASNEKVCRQIRARTNDICCAAHFRVTTLCVCVSLCVCVRVCMSEPDVGIEQRTPTSNMLSYNMLPQHAGQRTWTDSETEACPPLRRSS